MATKQSENGQKKKAPAFSAKIDALCDTGSSTKAFASVCISGRFVVRDIAVMGGKNGLFARMPCRSYQDRHGNALPSMRRFCPPISRSWNRARRKDWTKARTYPKGWLLRCKVAGVFRQSA